MYKSVLSKRSVFLVLILTCFWCARLPAQDDDDGNLDEDAPTETEASPVEIGVGGNIRLENPYKAELDDQYSKEVHLLWESRYVTEGRDNLDGDGLASVSSDFSLGGFTFAPWLAYGYDSSYRELNLNFIYGHKLTDQFQIYGGYTYLRSRLTGENATDHEVSVDLVYTPGTLFELSGSYYHSFDADGSFWELSLRHNKALNDKAILTLRGILGFNEGYIADGHNGLNHLQLRVGLDWHPVSRFEISSYAAYNFAIDSKPERFAEDAALHDFFWAGIGVTFYF